MLELVADGNVLKQCIRQGAKAYLILPFSDHCLCLLLQLQGYMALS
jgi:hypothetical protein